MDQLARILDPGQQPPYVEVYQHAPLMCASFAGHRAALAGVSPREQLHWCHSVQCMMDDVAAGLGLYKIKATMHDQPSCLFAISPDMPPEQQAQLMLRAAHQLRAALSKVVLPGGARLASRITIHAGHYAGGVVGKASWTYDVFGEDVQALLDMDRLNSPDCIQVSDPALALLSGADAGSFSPACKAACGGRELCLHRWVGQEWDDVDDATAAAAAAPRAQHTLLAGLPQLRRRFLLQPQPQQLVPVGPEAEQQRSLAEPGCSSALQPDLRFADARLEAAYMEAQGQPLARMDCAFITLDLLVTACCLWRPAGAGAPSWRLGLLATLGQWLVPALAAGWLLAAPAAYVRRREQLWVLHRVLLALHSGALLLLRALWRQRVTVGGTAASVAAAAAGSGLLGSQNGKALTLLADHLGFKIRFRAHALSTAFTAAVLALSALWCRAATGALPLGDLLLQLLVGCVVPTLLLYPWECEDRAWFAEGLRCGGGTPSSGKSSPKGKDL